MGIEQESTLSSEGYFELLHFHRGGRLEVKRSSHAFIFLWGVHTRLLDQQVHTPTYVYIYMYLYVRTRRKDLSMFKDGAKCLAVCVSFLSPFRDGTAACGLYFGAAV